MITELNEHIASRLFSLDDLNKQTTMSQKIWKLKILVSNIDSLI